MKNINHFRAFCRISAFSFFLIFLSPVLLFSQSPTNVKSKLSEYLKRVNAYGFSGQVLLAEKGKILLNEAYGYADKERGIPNKPDTPFNIASLTKQFTAAAILRLEADGKLKTGDPLSKYFENAPADKAQITIHQLLTHTSGLARGGDGKDNTTRDETVEKILKQPLFAKTGERFFYSNNGYHLLAAIIEKVSGKTYSEYLSENLFKPARMSKTGVYQDDRWKHEPIAQTANEWMKLESFADWNKAWNYGSGSVVSTAGDLYKWFSALNAGKILPKEESEKLFVEYNPSDDDNVSYGYGWYIGKLKDGSRIIYHGGDNPGYHSEFRWYVKDDRIIIIFTNYEMFEPEGVAVQKRIIARNLNRILTGDKIVEPPASIKLSANDLKKYEGEYRLPNGDKFKIWKNGNSLSIGAEGQEAINAITGYDADAAIAQKYAEADSLTEFILKSITGGEKEKIASRISKDAYDFYIPFLAKEYDSLKSKLGTLKEIKIQGTTSFPWDKNSYRTNVILNFEKGSTDLFLGYNNGNLGDVTTENGRPFPIIMPLAAQSKTDFSTFEIIRERANPLSFNITKDNSELRVKTQGKELIAKRVN